MAMEYAARVAHQWTATKEGLLEWLLVHVPTDQLPPRCAWLCRRKQAACEQVLIGASNYICHRFDAALYACLAPIARAVSGSCSQTPELTCTNATVLLCVVFVV